MHRNTAVLIAILAMIATLIVVVNVRDALHPRVFVVPDPTPAPTPKPVVQVPYTNTDCGVSLDYPSNLKLLESTLGGALFADSVHPTDSVLLSCQESIARPGRAASVTPMTIHVASSAATISATLYGVTGTDGETNPVKHLIFTNPKNGLDILVAGIGDIYDRVLESLQIL